MIIYHPRGKAQEYSPLAANLYKGCSHACTYCWAPKATYTSPDDFHKAEPRYNVLNQLSKEAERFKGPKEEVLLSFTSDPYQPIEMDLQITRKAIYTLNLHGFPVQILTKGGLRACRDFDLLAKNDGNKFSVTLTLDDPERSRRWEPNAALPEERIESLRLAHNLGIKTWVSFEPVIDPEAVYRLIEETHAFVDLYKIGKLNYHPHARTIDWPGFRSEIVKILEGHGKAFYLKRDLVEAKS